MTTDNAVRYHNRDWNMRAEVTCRCGRANDLAFIDGNWRCRACREVDRIRSLTLEVCAEALEEVDRLLGRMGVLHG